VKNIMVITMLAACLSACSTSNGPARLSDQALQQSSSAWPLTPTEALVFTDNDAAFANKVRMIRNAKKSVDLIYFIFSDDESSSVLAKELLAAAGRGVSVRLVVDYQNNYNRLDYFSMLEAYGSPRVAVRFYNRPTANIVKDAVYLTMGCSKEQAASHQNDCSAEKFAAIDAIFAKETIDGAPAGERNISNLDLGNSGLFLSGLYSKRGDVMALAVQQGQGLDPAKLKGSGSAATPGQKEHLKKLGQTYWESRTGNVFQRLQANADLFFAFSIYGQQLNPFKEQITSVLPIDRKLSKEELTDWDYLTDYTHHKFLLVDDAAVQMGGRNVENPYHMHANPLTDKDYVFMDTDIFAALDKGEGLARSFDRLWNFPAMVATLEEVRRHAPNDFVVNLRLAERACADTPGKPEREACVARESQTRVPDLKERIATSHEELERNAAAYHNQYEASIQPVAPLVVDRGSTLAYLENLPFDKNLPVQTQQRSYGALAGEEAKSGKYIHDIWLQAIQGVCASASAGNPKRVILHNAYFAPAANLTYELSRLMNGDFDCSQVTVTVLTNSIDTTDLNPVNLVARHELKAFTEFYQQQSDPEKRARFEYYEYRRPGSGHNLSLHSKVSVFGDDIVIGSANADIRSFMMDSNNAMLVRGAAEFNRNYLAFVDAILADPARVVKLNGYLANTPRAQMVQEDVATLRQIMAKYKVDKRMDDGQMKRVEERFVQMLNDAYQLTKDSIAPGLHRRTHQNQFNEEFKPI
jgi:cardiolipin synthase C